MTTIDSPLINAVRQLFDMQADQLPELKQPIKAFLAGGVAVHYWVGSRVTADVDAEFSLMGTGYRNFLPIDDVMAYVDDDGNTRAIHIDRNYTPVFALMHEDYVARSCRLGDKLGGEGKAGGLRPVRRILRSARWPAGLQTIRRMSLPWQRQAIWMPTSWSGWPLRRPRRPWGIIRASYG